MRLTACLLALLVVLGALPAGAVATETNHNSLGGAGPVITDYKETSAANAAITMATIAKTYARTLRSIQVVCSATPTATLTINSQITRVGLSNPIDLADITMSTTSTSAAQYVDIPILPTDVVEVTVLAAGAGKTCTPMIIEKVL